ncbi:hypothetical protein [Compostimonas suwonensis]|uniref:Uncharacterized protein n=1 Tax=Compostimonas suwonensis TaxID=1048394 RepID=A0A2M9BYW9_9MICO|nr:hypothetical protein [Compostimonas suwonensis]PJJ63275.1 hypothetical protein CLV54_0934 [Compostimonas suwonensis]
MRSDELWIAEDGNIDRVVPKGPLARFASYASGVIALLLGPALIVVVVAVGEFGWPTIVGGIAVLVVIGGLGLASMVSTARMQRRVERLSQRGRPAVAEVVASKPIPLGEETGIEVTLRVSGAEVPSFQMTHRGMPGQVDRLGQRFPVLVDPADGAYLLVR